MADTSLIFNIIAKDKSSGTFDKIKVGAAAAGAAIGGLLMSGVNAAIEKSKLDNKLAAQLGATPAQAKQLGQLSGKVYADGFGEDLPEVNAAIKAAAQNGLIDIKNASAETAQVATKNLLTVGSTLEEDSERVSSAVSQMMRTGMAKSSQDAMDLLVKATQNGVNKSQDLLDTMNEYGTQFRKLGLDGPQAMGLLSQAIKAGARDSDTAADAIKEFSIRAVDGSKTSLAGFKALGLNAKSVMADFGKGGDTAANSFNLVLAKLRAIKDPVKQSQVAVQLFGTKAEDLGKSLFAMNLDTAADQMKGYQGATAKASATAAQGFSSWSTLGRAFQMALIDKLNMALPVVNAVIGFMEKHIAWVQPLAIGLGILGAAIGIVTAAQWAWNTALAISPVTWIIIGIVALIAVIVLVATKTKFFQTVWAGVWGFLKGVGAWFAGPFANFFVAGWNAVWGFLKAVGAWFAGPFAGFFVSAWNHIVGAFNAAKNGISTAISATKNFFVGLYNTFNSIGNKINSKISSIVGWFRAMPGRIGGSLRNMFTGLWTGFRGAINRIIGAWNNLDFHIGGGSFMGMSIPGFTLGTPNLPYMATGGMIRSDGLFFGHAGETITKKAQVTRTGSGTGTGGGGGATLTIKGDGSKVGRFLLEILREAIRDKGGDPVKVLTAR